MMNQDETIGTYIMNSRIPCIVVGKDGEILSWNGAAKDVFPSLDDRSRLSIADLVLAEAGEEERTRFDFLFSSTAPLFVFDFPSRPDGAEQWLKLSMTRQADGNYLVLVDDVTGHKLKERHLIEAKESAEKASVTRSQFLANISHEIRTPIQTIIGMMELLSETKLDEEQTEYARQVKFSADVLLTLINDILDFSKGEAGQLKIENIEYDCSFVIERSIDLISMEAHRKGLELIIDIDASLPSLIIGDPGRLQQIILNLVKNAVKFTNAGYILVRATPVDADEGMAFGANAAKFVHFEIEDTGIGVDPLVQDKLFREFFQADSSTTRKFGGSGLGLAICRNIVELMKGRIGVRSNSPRGAVFWFDLPLMPATRTVEIAPLALDGATKFLIVDDNPRTRDILVKQLASLGYARAETAESGQEALTKLRNEGKSGKGFDIVFVDMIMPEMDGWRLAAEINADKEINDVRLYLMVPEGSFGAEAKMKLLEWFNGYLYKPIKKRMLAELLKDHYQASIDLEVVEELEEVIELEPEKKGPFAEGKTALIAEDHPVNRKLLTIFLEKLGAKVLQAADGQEAIQLAERHALDLVFMDIQMPRKNGYEAATWMRENGISCPIIACTASAQDNEREQCLASGMDEIMPKPYTKEDVERMAARWLGKEGNAIAASVSDPHAVFDYEGFLDIMAGDAEAARSLIREYLEQTTAHITILEEDVGSGDFDSASKTAHLIKGSSLNITAGKFAQVARRIEKAAGEGDHAGLLSLLEELKREYARLGDVLAKTGAR